MKQSMATMMSITLFAFGFTGRCGRKEPASHIVQVAESAGSGDLSSASAGSIREWLGKHRDLADRVEVLCLPVRQTASATWGDTTEGRLCGAAHELAFFKSAPANGDGRTFRPGLH